MRKRDNSLGFHGESGFTLVEILVALVILLLVVTACFPLFTMATKITHENRARMTAAELAKRELERILAQVTPANYISEEDDPAKAPLKTGMSEYYFDDDGNPLLDNNGNYSDTPDPDSRFALFEARKIVQWVDDPDDGLHPVDKFPFDYKALIIEVSCPSLFTGKVTKRADFKTFIAREGTASPITGVIIEVVRGWTDEDGNRIPVESAIVTLDGTGPSHTAMTNADGQALIPMTFPDDNTMYSYVVQTEHSGMIMRPDQQAGTSVEARPYTTNFVQVEMEEPATLTVKIAPAKNDVTITLDGGQTMGGIKSETLTAGQKKVTFTNLWPAGVDPNIPGRVCEGGTYSLTVDGSLLAYDSDLPDTGLKHPDDIYPADPDEPAVLNLWRFDSTYDGSPAWVASDDYLEEDDDEEEGETINPESPHRLSFEDPIDITPFKPASSNIEAHLTISFTGFSLSEYTEIADGFTLVYLGKKDAELHSNDTDDWAPFIKIGTDNGKRVLFKDNEEILATENDSGQIIISNAIIVKSDYVSSPFRLRFDSDPNIGAFYFQRFDIRCSYDNIGSIQFTKPADNLNLKISG